MRSRALITIQGLFSALLLSSCVGSPDLHEKYISLMGHILGGPIDNPNVAGSARPEYPGETGVLANVDSGRA